MATYFVTFGAYSTQVCGHKAAWALYRQALDLADKFGDIFVALVDGETCEIIACPDDD